MRAFTYHGTKDVRINTVPDPLLLHPQDIVLRVIATAICGSDLHLYRATLHAAMRSSTRSRKIAARSC